MHNNTEQQHLRNSCLPRNPFWLLNIPDRIYHLPKGKVSYAIRCTIFSMFLKSENITFTAKLLLPRVFACPVNLFPM